MRLIGLTFNNPFRKFVKATVTNGNARLKSRQTMTDRAAFLIWRNAFIIQFLRLGTNYNVPFILINCSISLLVIGVTKLISFKIKFCMAF